MKKIAIIGSSGGNLYNLGGADPEKLLSEIYVQCASAGFEIAAIQFIAAEASMDSAKPSTPACVYTLSSGSNSKPKKTYEGKLADVNDAVKETDIAIAAQIRKGNIHALIVMSADPKLANREVFAAAVEQQIPIVGTGGTSMAMIAASKAKVIATSGTTGTTSRTRAISFVASLAQHWGIKYRPNLGNSSGGDSRSGQSTSSGVQSLARE